MCSGQATSAGKQKEQGEKKYRKVFPWTATKKYERI